MNRAQIYQFEDYKQFLDHVWKSSLGRNGRPFSLSQWSRRLGYRSPRSIAMVLKGQRLPTTQMILSLSRHLKLTAQEHRYFELLVHKDRLEKRGESSAGIRPELRHLRPGVDGWDVRTLDRASFSYISDWFHLVIKQLVASPRFRENESWIRRRLRGKVTGLQIRRAIETMVALRILERDPATGRLRISRKESLFNAADVPSSAARNHQIQMMERAKEALNEQGVDAREFMTLTFRFDRARLQEAKRALREFRDGFNKAFSSDDAGDVYQLNIQFFEHTGEERA